MKNWQRVEPTTIQKVGFRTIVDKTYLQPDGKTKVFTITGAEGSAAVAVLAITPDMKIIISREFRPGPDMVMDKMPGGIVDDGEDPEVAARRELMEETGYQAGELIALGSLVYDAYTHTRRYYFLATDCVPSGNEQKLDQGEFIEVRTITVAEFMANVKAGKMTDAGIIPLAEDHLKAMQILP